MSSLCLLCRGVFCGGQVDAEIAASSEFPVFVIGLHGHAVYTGKQVFDEILAVLPDVTGDWTLTDVTAAAFADRFQPNTTTRDGLAPDARVYWVRLSIDNRSAQDEVLLLQFIPAFVVDLYLWSLSGELVQQRAGLFVSFAEWAFPISDYRYPLFSVTIPKQTLQTIYVRLTIEPCWLIATERRIAASAWLTETMLRDVAGVRYFIGVMLGVFIGLALYHGVVFVIVRERAYLYLVVLNK